MFCQIAEGVDEETWLHHLKRQEYSKWFEVAIKDDALVELAEQLEQMDPPPKNSRDQILNLIRDRYTAPAKG